MVILTLKTGVVKMYLKKPSEETDYEDFFSRFDFMNFFDKMDEFMEK